MAIERSVSLRLPNERPHVRVVRQTPLDHNANLRNMGLLAIGETSCSSASAPVLNLAYFGYPGRPSSLHPSKLDAAIENLSGTLERGSTDHREKVSLPLRYRCRLRSSSLGSRLGLDDTPAGKVLGKRFHGGLGLPPAIEEGQVISEDPEDREDDLNTAIKWLHQEILQMKRQDRALIRRLFELRSTIHQMSGGQQSSSHNLSVSMASLRYPDYHALASDSWPLLGAQPEPPRDQAEARDMVQDFHARVRAVSVVAAMPSGRTLQEVGSRLAGQEHRDDESSAEDGYMSTRSSRDSLDSYNTAHSYRGSVNSINSAT